METNNDYSGSTKPITLEDFNKYIECIFKPRKRAEPNCDINWELMAKHGIGHFWESPDLILFSPSELKRAKEVGAVTIYENKPTNK